VSISKHDTINEDASVFVVSTKTRACFTLPWRFGVAFGELLRTTGDDGKVKSTTTEKGDPIEPLDTGSKTG
jgi:hypothetical protein